MIANYIENFSIYQGIGLIGVFVYVSVFATIQFDKISGNDLIFPICRLFASVCVLISLIAEFNYTVLALNSAYAIISIYGIIRRYPQYIRERARSQLAAPFATVERTQADQHSQIHETLSMESLPDTLSTFQAEPEDHPAH